MSPNTVCRKRKMAATDVPSQMHAVQLVQKGPADKALQYNQIDVPKLKSPKDVLVQVKAVGVNPVEAKFRAGNLPFPVSLPAIIGGDYAGVVVQKGSQVTDFDIGDAVFGSLSFPLGPRGSYAEYASINKHLCGAVGSHLFADEDCLL